MSQPIEIEAKFKVNNELALKERIADIGAVFKEELYQRDTYYIHPVKECLIGQKTYLRVRTSNDKSYTSLHYKDQDKDYEWVELETQVNNGETLRSIYQDLGFPIDVDVEKIRSVYTIPEGEIVIDQVNGAGCFIEIEVDTMENLRKYCKELNFQLGENHQLKNVSYADIIRKNVQNLNGKQAS